MASFVGMSILLSACSNVSVNSFSTGRNRYQIVALSASQSASLTGANEKAKRLCADKNMGYEVLAAKTIYQGAFDKQTDEVLNFASSFTKSASDSEIQIPTVKTSADYKTTMTIKCVPTKNQSLK